MKKWPGTGIEKSQDNAFNWREAPSSVSGSKEFKASVNAVLNCGKKKTLSHIVFSKASKNK